MRWQHTKKSEADYHGAPAAVQWAFDKRRAPLPGIYCIPHFTPRNSTSLTTFGRRVSHEPGDFISESTTIRV